MVSQILTWGGLLVAMSGIVMLGACVVRLRRLKAADVPKDRFDAGVRRMIALNAAGVATGCLGVALMILGAIL